jgi:hypothetical protein
MPNALITAFEISKISLVDTIESSNYYSPIFLISIYYFHIILLIFLNIQRRRDAPSWFTSLALSYYDFDKISYS